VDKWEPSLRQQAGSRVRHTDPLSVFLSTNPPRGYLEVIDL
jgi:hypothetical protein